MIVKTYQGLDVASRAPALLPCCPAALLPCCCPAAAAAVSVAFDASRWWWWLVSTIWWWWPFRESSSVRQVLETRLTRLEHHLSLNKH
jgi:hypothetical protein